MIDIMSCDHHVTSKQHIQYTIDTYLKHFVGRWLNTGNHVGRFKGHLLNIGKVVFGVAVENHLTNLNQREVCMGPDLFRRRERERGLECWRVEGRGERGRRERVRERERERERERGRIGRLEGGGGRGEGRKRGSEREREREREGEREREVERRESKLINTMNQHFIEFTYLGEIKWVEGMLLSLLKGHHLNVHGP